MSTTRNRGDRGLRLDESGYTIAELLVAAFVGLVVLSVVFAAVSVQGRGASYQSGLADAQLTSRGAGEIILQDLRMAGFGMLGVPATAGVQPVTVATAGETTTITLRGNYSNVVTTLALAAPAGSSTVVVNPPASGTFQVGNLVLVDSGMNAEVKTITSVGSAGGNVTIGLDSNLVAAYPLGPEVTQLEVVTYTFAPSGGVNLLRRNNQVMGDNVSTFQIQYVDQNGNVTATPGATLRSAILNLVAAQPTKLPDNPYASSTVTTEANMRNLTFRLTTN